MLRQTECLGPVSTPLRIHIEIVDADTYEGNELPRFQCCSLRHIIGTIIMRSHPPARWVPGTFFPRVSRPMPEA